MIATYVATNNKISSLSIGEKTSLRMLRFEVDPEFEVIEANLSVERKEESQRRGGKALRVYAIEDTRRNGSNQATLIMDEKGRPVSFESVGQMGGLRAELIQPSPT
jgi:hypothetical protein